jgi:hypothetical protein
MSEEIKFLKITEEAIEEFTNTLRSQLADPKNFVVGKMNQCVQCEKTCEGNVWLPGQCCIAGTLFACSRLCAEKFCAENNINPIDIDEIKMNCGMNSHTFRKIQKKRTLMIS